MGKVIIIANQKGGVGKTTTAVNLSACLAAKNQNTLLIDFDPQGNATSGVGIDKNEVENTIYDVLINEFEIKKSIIPTAYKKLSVIASNSNLAGAEIELVDAENREFVLKNAVAAVKDEFDYIIIDCPPSLGLITINAFVAADTVLVPIQCEYYAMEGLSQLTSSVMSIKKSFNTDIEFEGVLLTMYDKRTNLSVQVAQEVKKFFPNKVYKTVIPRNVRLSEAPSYGEPIIAYDKLSMGAISYTRLAKELINNNKEVK